MWLRKGWKVSYRPSWTYDSILEKKTLCSSQPPLFSTIRLAEADKIWICQHSTFWHSAWCDHLPLSHTLLWSRSRRCRCVRDYVTKNVDAISIEKRVPPWYAIIQGRDRFWTGNFREAFLRGGGVTMCLHDNATWTNYCETPLSRFYRFLRQRWHFFRVELVESCAILHLRDDRSILRLLQRKKKYCIRSTEAAGNYLPADEVC